MQLVYLIFRVSFRVGFLSILFVLQQYPVAYAGDRVDQAIAGESASIFVPALRPQTGPERIPLESLGNQANRDEELGGEAAGSSAVEYSSFFAAANRHLSSFYSIINVNLSPRRIVYISVGAVVSAGAIAGIVLATNHKNSDSGSVQGRGMYLSLQTTQIGSLTLDSKYQNILGNSFKEFIVTNFISKYNFQSVAIYDLNKILSSSHLTNSLTNFIENLHQSGVKEVLAIAGSVEDIAAIWNYQRSHNANFNGVITEVEFWSEPVTTQQANYSDFLALIKKIKTQANQNGYPNFLVSSYIGKIDTVPGKPPEDVARELSENLDRIYLACYGVRPSSSYSKCQDRLSYFSNFTHPSPVVPILSAEGVKVKAGDDSFLGDWLASHSLQEAEQSFRADVTNSPKTNYFNILDRFHYYEFVFLNEYLTH